MTEQQIENRILSLINHAKRGGSYEQKVYEFAKQLANKSQLKPQEGERVLNLCNDIGCDGHVVLRKTCEKCGRSVAFNPLKQ